MDNWTLFLDRDGVINKKAKEHDYIKKWEEFVFLPKALESLAILSRIFGKIIIVSNQQGIGKGLFTEFDLETINNRMLNRISNSGGRIDLTLYDTHLMEENHPNRKPNIGMALRAKEIFPEIDFSKSIMVGDSDTDVEFGKRAGMKTVHIGKNFIDLWDWVHSLEEVVNG